MLLSQAVEHGRRARMRQKMPPWMAELGPELASHDTKKSVYLMTLARVLADRLQVGDLRDVRCLSKQNVLDAVLDSWGNPVQTQLGGRSREESDGHLVLKAVVFEEPHADGDKHFHIAVLLGRQMRFAPCKRTLLERHRMVVHFSTTHTQWWSALRYGTTATPDKPTVDSDPLQWVPPGHAAIDLFAEKQQPFIAGAWRRRREKKDDVAAGAGQTNTFTKLDFTALVLSKGLETKAAVLRYFKLHGTVAMQAFLSNHQRKIADYLEDAFEWQGAEAAAAEEEQTDWALVAAWSEKQCPKGECCEYHVAAREFFERNAENFSQDELAEALRRIIVAGPGKDAKVPFLVGTTNTGKTSLVESFDQLFGEQRVYHLPAVTDKKYALRNWLRNKRFLLWDEFSPVEFADSDVLPVTQFKKAFNGQWFEIQVPQGYHDGNKDFRWKHGAVFTNKSVGLWNETRKVSAEDIMHLRSRVREFQCTQVFLQQGQRRPDIPQCAVHLAKWICEGAAAYDARFAAMPLALGADQAVQGLQKLLAAAVLPEAVAGSLARDVAMTGAIHVRELTRQDWTLLPSWASLRAMEQRRIWRVLG